MASPSPPLPPLRGVESSTVRLRLVPIRLSRRGSSRFSTFSSCGPSSVMARRCETRPSWTRSVLALFWSSSSRSGGGGGCAISYFPSRGGVELKRRAERRGSSETERRQYCNLLRLWPNRDPMRHAQHVLLGWVSRLEWHGRPKSARKRESAINFG